MVLGSKGAYVYDTCINMCIFAACIDKRMIACSCMKYGQLIAIEMKRNTMMI